jgi:hypothetical protein
MPTAFDCRLLIWIADVYCRLSITSPISQSIETRSSSKRAVEMFYEHASFHLKIMARLRALIGTHDNRATYALEAASAANIDNRNVAHNTQRLTPAGRVNRSVAQKPDAVRIDQPMKAFAAYQTAWLDCVAWVRKP